MIITEGISPKYPDVRRHEEAGSDRHLGLCMSGPGPRDDGVSKGGGEPYLSFSLLFISLLVKR